MDKTHDQGRWTAVFVTVRRRLSYYKRHTAHRPKRPVLSPVTRHPPKTSLEITSMPKQSFRLTARGATAYQMESGEPRSGSGACPFSKAHLVRFTELFEGKEPAPMEVDNDEGKDASRAEWELV